MARQNGVPSDSEDDFSEVNLASDSIPASTSQEPNDYASKISGSPRILPSKSPTFSRPEAFNLDLDDAFATDDDDIGDKFQFGVISLRPSVVEGEEDEDEPESDHEEVEEGLEDSLEEVDLDRNVTNGHSESATPVNGFASHSHSYSTESHPPLPITTDLPTVSVAEPPTPDEDGQVAFVDVSLSPAQNRASPFRSSTPIHTPRPSTSSIPPDSPPQSARSTGSFHRQQSPHPSISSSPSLPLPASMAAAAPPYTGSHRITRSAGPSTLEKVLSKTRPTHLPPKPKEEDNKHLRDWEDMMKASRVAGR